MRNPLVLLVEDDPSQSVLIRRWLEKEAYRVESVFDGESSLTALTRLLPDIICLDLHLPGMSGLHTLQKIKEHHPHLPVIILTSDSSVDSVVEAMRLGAHNYLVKPIDRTRLITDIRNAEKVSKMSVRLVQLERESEGPGYGAIVGNSPPMVALYRTLDRIAPTEITVLLNGETGTGKELVARALHENSGRHKGPLVTLNCAAIPESLQESELFGHEKGAFTGATKRKIGLFEETNQGTLFLDEVAELSLPLQAKLLRVLQERTFRRLGGTQDISTSFRLVAATHQDLDEAVRKGRFREDLFYRIAVFELELAPLRERPEDISDLVTLFLMREAKSRHGEPVRVSEACLGVLRRHLWPGNIRELQNAIQRASVVALDGVIQTRDLPPRILDGIESEDAAAEDGSEVSDSTRAHRRENSTDRLPLDSHLALGLASDDCEIPSLAVLERRAIEACFSRTGGNLSEMARQLRIGRTTLYRKLKKYEIK